jgi:hypothetical protein
LLFFYQPKTKAREIVKSKKQVLYGEITAEAFRMEICKIGIIRNTELRKQNLDAITITLIFAS